jgi:hypothetical protein
MTNSFQKKEETMSKEGEVVRGSKGLPPQTHSTLDKALSGWDRMQEMNDEDADAEKANAEGQEIRKEGGDKE